MSAEATDGEIVNSLRETLIAMDRLTPEGVARIEEAMRNMNVGFGHAAVQLGLVTPEELLKAAQVAYQVPSQASESIIAKGRLTPDVAVRIDEAMRSMGIGFGEAAIQLGLITPEEFAEATLAREQPPPTRDGIFEAALQRTTLNRGLPVKYVGTVKPGSALTLLRDPDHAYSEKIRALRTELMLLNSTSRSGNVLVVLSACRGEGRTQLCAELAIAFSQLAQRTLLVDADLRRPRVHALFDSENGFGLGPALATGGVPQLLGVEKLPHLSVLTAGFTVPNPLELLTNGHFQRQISDWRKKYSMVIIDTPPITEFADGLAIASFAEQVVIVGRSGSTPHKNMKEMLRRMGGTQSRIVGAVINSF
jgi:protein-tyrosine kinase